jgi:hypothetical protein
MPKPNNKRKKSSLKGDSGMNDWIASLAKQSAVDSNNTTSGRTSQSPSVMVASKEERIQKRANKKARRQERQEERQRPVATPANNTATAAATAAAAANKLPKKRVSDHDSTKRRLKRLAEALLAVRSEHQNDQRRLYTPDEDSNRIKRRRALNEINIQPRPSDYSGIGLARKSLFLPLQDPSHIPKLEEEFKEHIPGFFGKQRTKAMKKQLDGNMLWRKLADEKQKGGGGIPKKYAHLSPDGRIQAMIDEGMIC